MDRYERDLLAVDKGLAGRGVRSVLHAQGIRPRLGIEGIEDLPGCGFDNNVIAAALAGQWMFFWPWAEPIGPAGQLARTAAAVIESLGLHDHDSTASSVPRTLPPAVPSLDARRKRRQAGTPLPRRPFGTCRAQPWPAGPEPAS